MFTSNQIGRGRVIVSVATVEVRANSAMLAAVESNVVCVDIVRIGGTDHEPD